MRPGKDRLFEEVAGASTPPSRRSFLSALAALSVTLRTSPAADGVRGRSSLVAETDVAGPRSEAERFLEPWSPGTLDIHHIATGRGNATFIVMPDGTTLLLDAGALRALPQEERYIIAPRPDGSRRPGEWITRYLKQHWPAGKELCLDYFALTHLHQDHMGGVDEDPSTLPQSRLGNYRLTGIADVHEVIPVRVLLDRAFPDYNYPVPLTDRHQLNYRAFVNSFVARGGKAERIRCGSSTQIVQQVHSSGAGALEVRALAVNGEVWNDAARKSTATFPPLSSLAHDLYPTENKCSAAFLLRYGPFRYLSGGDMESGTRYGRAPWADIESAVAEACGPVTIAVANHHGYAGACGERWVRALRPQAFVILAWDSAHPAITPLDHMLSEELYAGPRSIFATAVKPENLITTRRLAQLKSIQGHVLIRVAPTGSSYTVFVLDNGNPGRSDRIVHEFSPARQSG